MKLRWAWLWNTVLVLNLAGCASPGMEPSAPAAARAQVMAAERAFARSLAQRDLAAFARHLSEDAVFLSGNDTLRGRQAVIAGWTPFFEWPTAPFSWKPDQVEVLAAGGLALSTGPVRNPAGAIVARFTTIWRWERPGVWRVVFDRGCPVCPGAPSP